MWSKRQPYRDANHMRHLAFRAMHATSGIRRSLTNPKKTIQSSQVVSNVGKMHTKGMTDQPDILGLPRHFVYNSLRDYFSPQADCEHEQEDRGEPRSWSWCLVNGHPSSSHSAFGDHYRAAVVGIYRCTFVKDPRTIADFTCSTSDVLMVTARVLCPCFVGCLLCLAIPRFPSRTRCHHRSLSTWSSSFSDAPHKTKGYTQEQ